MNIRRLAPSDTDAFHALRLAALQNEPSAFGSSYEEEKDFPRITVESRLVENTDRGVFGAFEGDKLIGLVALGRESRIKLAHKAMIWGMYVSPESRGKGIGRALLLQVLALARSVPGILQVNLCVNASNAPALRLYESVGFKAFGQEPGAMLVGGALYDEVHMYLQLRSGV